MQKVSGGVTTTYVYDAQGQLAAEYGAESDIGTRYVRQRFLKIEALLLDLGPSYNATSCGGCHNQPSIGGVGNVTVLRAGVVQNGRYEAPQGGDRSDHAPLLVGCVPYLSQHCITRSRLPYRFGKTPAEPQ